MSMARIKTALETTTTSANKVSPIVADVGQTDAIILSASAEYCSGSPCQSVAEIDPQTISTVSVPTLAHQSSPIKLKKWHNHQVAVKATNDSSEIALLKKMVSWNIPAMVPIYGYYQSNNAQNIVMKYMPDNFADFLSFMQPSWGERFQILIDILTFTAAIHQHNIVHNDFKGLNVLVNQKQRGYVCDFGSSLDLAAGTKPEDIHVATTPGFSAPETLSQKFSPKSDMYSLGTLMWEMASEGKDVFPDADSGDVILRTSKGETETIPADCPEILATLIRRCWMFNPGDRPSADNILHALEKDDTVSHALRF